MKKRVLSMFMALALCLTLLPTAALADELGPVDGTSTVETAGTDAEAEAKAKAGAEAVAAVQAMISELPSLGELKGMDSDTLNEAYMAVQSAYDAYEALSEEQQAQVTGADRFEELFGWFNSQVAPLADVYYYCDVVDVATGKMVQGRWNRTATASLTDGAGDTELRSNAVYVIAPDEQVTIRGSLTVPENSNDIYLFLCQNATLTIEGSLILNSNALTIFGSTTSLDAADSGKMIIENSGDGAAIQADGSDRNVTIRGGKLEIHSNTSKQITDAHASVLPSAWGNTGSGEYKVMKATLDGQQLEAADWDGKTQLTGGTLLIEWCEHEDNEKLSYVDNKDNATHHFKCDLCGFEWTKGEYSKLDHEYDKYEKINETYHKATCVCGYEASAQEHKFETGLDNKPVWTSDGKGHVSGVCACGYSSDTVKAHDYNESGTCKDCGFKPAFEDSEGNLYRYNGSDSIDALNEAIKKGETSFMLVNFAQGEGADTATVEAAFALETDANVTLNMNGYTLTNSGNPTLTVENGTLKITGDAVINQTGRTELAAPAVKVTGGTLIFDGKLNATGASGKPAVLVTNGTLRLKAGDVLNGGVSVEGSTTYANVNALLGDGLAFAKEDEHSIIVVKGNVKSIDENVVVKEHGHSFTLGSDGKYTCVCGYTCPHNDFKDGKCTICGYGCAHTNVDENGVCRDCKTQMVAKIDVGGTTTYTTDLGTTLYEAADGTKITLLANAAVGTVPLQGKTVTLDLNGKTVKNSDRGSNRIQIGSSHSPASLIITGRGSFISVNQVLVVENGTLDLSRWTGDDSYICMVTISGADSRFISPTGTEKIRELAFIKGADTASLNGGRYDVIVYKRNKRIKLGDLLAEGYAFRQNGTFLEYASKLESNGTVEEVEVVKCPHADAEGGKCLYCNQGGILARVGDTTYDDVGKAVKGWLANGGTLTLYDNAPTYSNGNDVDFSSGSNNPFIIDLNGCKFNDNGAAIKLSGGKSLTIMDSEETTSSQGAFGPLVADSGKLTLESGYLQKLTVPSDSSATILLKGGKVSALACPVPVFNLLGNGYCLMSGNITVDPTTILNSGTGTYTIKNPQPLITADKKNGSSSKGERKIPFTLSLKANDSEVGRMQFKWYFIKEDGTTALLAESGDVTATTNDVFTYDATTQSKVAAGWDDTDLKVRDKPYDVICVVTGKDSNGAYLWQTPLRGYKLTIEQTDLKDLKLEFTQVEDTSGFAGPFKGNIKDGKGTFVFEPYGGDVGDASTLTYCFEVYLDGQELEKGKDYIIVDKSNEAKYAGAHTLTIQGMGDYKGTATHTWRIEPYKLTRENYNPPNITKVYDGTTGFDFSKDGNWGSFKENVANRPNDAGTGKNPALGADGDAISIYLKPEDLKASAVTLDSPDVGDRTASYTITLKAREGQSEPNFAFEDGEPPTIQVTAPAYITKASLSPLPEAGKLNVANNHAGVYTLDLAALLPTLDSPKEYGKVTYELDATMLASGYYAVGTATIENGKLILPIKAVETKKTGSIGSVKVKVSTTNYHDFTLTINVNATNKIVPTGEPTLSATTLTYGQALSAIKLSGKLHDNVNNKDVEGTFTWADGTVKPSAGSYEAAWKFTPTDGNTYAETTGTVSITVNKAKPTGDPIYTKITAANKTLKDANLKSNTSWPTGTIQWVDKDGKELPDTTEVKANTTYKWIFTPTGADADNYTTATGELTLYSVSTGGGGGGGSSSGSTRKTETTTKPDGTKVETVTKPDGTTIKTETKKDGSVSKTETKKDGSSVTENKAADGSTGTVKTDKHGQTTAETTLSSKAIEDAKKSGEPVKAPVEVEASRDSNTAPTVKVELPKGAGETKVEIPVSNVKPGTVAVLVHPDGTEEIVKNSLPTEDGIQLTVNGGATVKIVDNSKDFADTRNHWAKDAIDFVSARGLVNGMNDSIYAPNASTTRAQLWTILARQNDADLNGGNTWYEKAQLWSKDKGVSDGANPNGTIDRAQMVTMLWRAAGQPTAGGTANFTDVPADSYYANAVSWAVEGGITAGVGGGRFDPAATCTRAQIATFLWRAMAE